MIPYAQCASNGWMRSNHCDRDWAPTVLRAADRPYGQPSSAASISDAVHHWNAVLCITLIEQSSKTICTLRSASLLLISNERTGAEDRCPSASVGSKAFDDRTVHPDRKTCGAGPDWHPLKIIPLQTKRLLSAIFGGFAGASADTSQIIKFKLGKPPNRYQGSAAIKIKLKAILCVPKLY